MVATLPSRPKFYSVYSGGDHFRKKVTTQLNLKDQYFFTFFRPSPKGKEAENDRSPLRDGPNRAFSSFKMSFAE